ncbi:unnamed protein product, partial [Didymodactylos carnosus]
CCCKFCLTHYDGMKIVNDERQILIRIRESHEIHVQYVQTVPTDEQIYGVVGKVKLSMLPSFHPISTLPPDLIHVRGCNAPINICFIMMRLITSAKLDVDDVLDMSLIVTIKQTTEVVKIYRSYSFGTEDLWILLLIDSDKKEFSSIINYDKLLELIENDHPIETTGYMLFKSLEEMSKELSVTNHNMAGLYILQKQLDNLT